jgi:hypothetical protein
MKLCRGRAAAILIGSVLAGCLCARPTAAAVVQASFAGGDPYGDQGYGLALNTASGDVYVMGVTYSPNFPGAANGPTGPSDYFVTRFSADLRTLVRTVIFGGTASGGSLSEQPCGIGVDPLTGDVVVAGVTNAPDFPGTSGGFQEMRNGAEQDIVIARFNAALDLEQATYFGGSNTDSCVGLAIDPETGDVFVYGTGSNDYPGTAGSAKPTWMADAFVARLSADLRSLRRTTYVGGSLGELPDAIAINPVTGDLVVAGSSSSVDFPPGAGASPPPGFIARYDRSLTQLLGVTRYGASDATGIAFDPRSGDIVAAGRIRYAQFPDAVGGAQAMYGGGGDGFAVRFTKDGTFVQGTFIGGSGFDRGNAAVVDPRSGDVLVWGDAGSMDLPGVETGFQSMFGGSVDGFLVRFNAALTVRKQATYVGGMNGEQAYGMVYDPNSGDVYVAGWGGDPDFPGVAGGADPEGGAQDAVVVRLTVDLGAGEGPTPTLTATEIGAPSPTATSTEIAAPSPTATAPPTATASPTQPVSATATRTAAATPTVTGAATPCAGDCNGNGAVSVDELVRGVGAALGNVPVATCTAIDTNGDGQIAVNELVGAVGSALSGCAA